MAAVDPDAAPEYGDVDPSKPPRATLKMIRAPAEFDDEDSDEESDEDDESSDDEDVNGGPSDPAKSKKLKEAAAKKEMKDAMDEDDSDEDGDSVDIKSVLNKLMKGKDRAPDVDDESDDSDDMPEEIVICTLDPEKVRLSRPCVSTAAFTDQSLSTINKGLTWFSPPTSKSYSWSLALMLSILLVTTLSPPMKALTMKTTMVMVMTCHRVPTSSNLVMGMMRAMSWTDWKTLASWKLIRRRKPPSL